MYRVRNVHQRLLPVSRVEASTLIDSLASPADRVWPRAHWPAIRLDGPLASATKGRHGPVAYTVEQYLPGQCIRFRFTRPAGFDGTHVFKLEPAPEGKGTYLRHVLEMRVRRSARLTWPIVFRPLHDALVEDALDCAESALGLDPPGTRWSVRVRVLRRLLRPFSDRVQDRTAAGQG
jgi:hypothetical protein